MERVAQDLGQIASVYRLSQSDKVSGDLPFRALTRKVGRDLGESPLSPQEAGAVLDKYIVDLYRDPMQLLTSLMHDATALGVTRSALNISLGLNQLHIVQGAESHLSNETYRANLDRALGLDSQNTLTATRKQALLDRVERVLQGSGQVAEARQTWQDAVESFESNHNSVVVAAGNDGDQARELQAAGYRISPDVDQNFLATPNVTVVAATNTRGQLASYSRLGNEIDLLANGTAGFLSQGTSLAAPLVSASMRAVHCANPSFDSAQAEQTVIEQLTDSTWVGPQNRPVLQTDKASRYIASVK